MSTTSFDPLLTEIFDIVYSSTYCVAIDSNATKIYLQCFKDLIRRYLNDNACHVYVSVPDELLSLYQSEWPLHQRLFYTNYDFIPNELPLIADQTYIYIYHHPKKKHTIDDQLSLVNFSTMYDNIKYIYVGKLNKITTVTIIKMFRYYFYFNNKASAWCRYRLPIFGDSAKKITQKYYKMSKRKKNYTTLTLYDYFIFCDTIFQTKKLYNFNKRILIKKKHVQKTTTNVAANTIKPTKIQYIYTDTPTNLSHLIMPDGKRENFDCIVEKYSNLIEI